MRGLVLLGVLGLVGCTYYGRYSIQSIPANAHIIGPNDADWGTTRNGQPASTLLSSKEKGCRKYTITLVVEDGSAKGGDYDNKTIEFEGCTLYGSIDAADQHSQDPQYKKVYQLQRRALRSDLQIFSSPPGATVFLGNDSIGVTSEHAVPLTITWSGSDDTKELRFEKPGYQTAMQAISPHTTSVNAVLQPTKAGER